MGIRRWSDATGVVMRVAFCIPGPNFSGWFLENWTALIKSLPPEIEWRLFRNYNPNVHVVRNQVLDRARMFRPDYYMWIDSDINFTPDDFYKLLDHKNVSIVSGMKCLKIWINHSHKMNMEQERMLYFRYVLKS